MSKLTTCSKPIATAMAALVLVNCAGTAPPASSQPGSEVARIADLQIVDCLLPGQVRRLGSGSYLTPRRPLNTTAADCRIRGGEYVEFDRADYRTALTVWMAAAENNDAEAQTNVGEIFERGAGGTPNYEAAAIWYQKAAEQGNPRAQFNLGTLYEQGLGVEKNPLLALNWYRKAWGLPEDNLIYQSAAYREQQSLREQLKKQLEEKSIQINLLKKQIEQLQSAAGNQADSSMLEKEMKQLRIWIANLEQERAVAQSEYAAQPFFREPTAIERPVARAETGSSAGSDLKFGKYYALVIGNQTYSRLDNLYTPRRDAQQVAQLLEVKYGFSVQTLLDATNIDVMQAINDLNDVLGEEDNLLIFYAGHGSRVKSGDIEDGYWLPVNADPPPTDTFWVSNEFVTRHLARLKAKRVLVVADSCYAGLLSRAPGFLFLGDDRQYTEDYIRYKLSRKGRLLLSSGGDQPVLDNAGDGNSVFAKAFLEELQANEQILAGPELFIRIRDRVSQGAKSIGVEQQPEFKAIKGAGHEVGDFFFVPKESY